MDRRQFIRMGVVGAGASLLLPRSVLAEIPDCPMAGGVYHTRKAPGRWEKKVDSHLPQIEVESSAEGVVVHVITDHKMSGTRHYIVKHVLLDADFHFIDEHLFDPENDKKAESVFTLPTYEGVLYALSVCNLHDTWLDFVTV